MATQLNTTQEVLDYLKTTRHDTYDMSRCVKPHMRDILLPLFLRINWMRTWFRTNHPILAHKAGTPFKETVDFFAEISKDDFPIIFTLWCLHLVNKFPLDTGTESDGKIVKATEDYEKQNCLLNTISDLTFLSAANTILLSKTYLDDLGEVLKVNLVRTQKGDTTFVTNPMLAEEICTTIYFRAAEAKAAAEAN
jgi:hypothetical protein